MDPFQHSVALYLEVRGEIMTENLQMKCARRDRTCLPHLWSIQGVAHVHANTTSNPSLGGSLTFPGDLSKSQEDEFTELSV